MMLILKLMSAIITDIFGYSYFHGIALLWTIFFKMPHALNSVHAYSYREHIKWPSGMAPKLL